MISSSRKFVFVHVPRSGGNSIQSTLLEYADESPVIKDSGMQQFELRHASGLTKHSRLEDYRTKIGEVIRTEFFKFAVVRNSWDRLLSRWFLFKYGPQNMPKTKGRWLFRHNLDPVWDSDRFAQFLHWHLDRKGRDAWSIMPWITLDNEVCLDFYIRFDALQGGYDEVCERLNLPWKELPRINRSRRKHPYQAYYDDTTRDLVADICAEEIEYFGFRYDD